MKRILYLTLTIMLCLTFFTAVTWAEEKLLPPQIKF